MGAGESKGNEMCLRISEIISNVPADKLCTSLENELRTMDKPEELLSLEIPADESIKVIAALTPLLYQKAVQINSCYTSLKPNELPVISTEGLPAKLLILNKAILAALCKPLILSQYLWHIDHSSAENAKEVPSIIRLAESFSVLLFVHEITTYYENTLPPPATPLDLDKRIAWKLPKTKYDIYGEKWINILRTNYSILLMFLQLAYCSRGPEIDQNGLLEMVASQLWKNIDTLLYSIEYLLTEPTDPYLEKQEDFIKFKSIAANFLLVLLNTSTGETFPEAEIGRLYITQKAAQLRSKFGINISEKACDCNYVAEYVAIMFDKRKLFAEFKHSLRNFIKLLVICKEITTESEWFDLIFREALLCLEVVKTPAPTSVIDVIVDLATLMLYPSPNLSQDTMIMVFSLIISIFTTSIIMRMIAIR